MTDYRDLDVTPAPEFADELENLLLRDLDLLAGDVVVTRGAAAAQRLVRPARWRWVLAGAAAALLLTVVVLLSNGQTTRPPVTVPPTSTTLAGITTVPGAALPDAAPGDLVPGSYQVTTFDVPFTFESTDDWIVANNRPAAFVLIRLTGPRLSVTSGIFDGQTAAQVANNACSGALDLGSEHTAALLGEAGTRVEATATGTCVLQLATDIEPVTVQPGDVVQFTVADVGGQVVVVAAGTNVAVWERTADEVNRLIASMQRIPE